MQELLANPGYVWLAIGAGLILFEALTTPGLGLFLGGLGALCTGIVIVGGMVDGSATGLQFVSFFSFTVFWAVVLWKPLKKFRTGNGKQGQSYHHMVGGTAVVGERGLKRGEIAPVIWSGSPMNAELDSSSPVDSVAPGALVEIRSVAGNMLKVTPK